MISIDFEKLTLSNGLDVILSQDRSLPVTAVNLWYHVGSKDEEAGKTGFAHLFEHVMFEGSKHHDQSYFEPLQKVGANLNGSTTADRTNYWENVPSDHLELALWLESDRMGYLLEVLTDRKLEIQRDVVKNERRQNYENRPYGMAQMLIQPALFPAPHPYSWTTIGSPEDLDNASLEDVKSFFRRFYVPNNASLSIVGDFDLVEARNLVERYFGDIPAGPGIDRTGRMDTALSGTVELTTYDRVQLPRLYLAWPTVSDFSQHQPALDVTAAILGDGRSSRLYRSLVYESRAARDVRVYHHAQEISGEMVVQATANPGHSLEELQSEVLRQIDRIRNGDVDERELQRAKNRIQAAHVFQLERFGGFGGRADQLNHYHTFAGDAEFINKDMDGYLSLTIDDLRDASAILGESMVKLSVNPQAERSASAVQIERGSAPEAASRSSFTPPVPSRAALDNGMNILHLQRRGLPTVAFGLVVRSGAASDPAGSAGLAHLTTTMLPEGTRRRTSAQISDEMEFLGSHLRAEASREHMLLTSDGLNTTWRDTLAILGDVALNADFPERDLERVRANILTDLRRVSDSPATISARATRGVMFGPGTPYGHPMTGNEESVGGTSRDDLKSFFASHFNPANSTFVIVGDLSLDEAVEAANDAFGGWKASGDHVPDHPTVATPERSPTTIYIADKPGAAQSVVRTGHLTILQERPRLPRVEHPELHIRRPVLGASQHEPAPGQGVQLRLHVDDRLVAPALDAGRGRRCPDSGDQRDRNRDAQRVRGRHGESPGDRNGVQRRHRRHNAKYAKPVRDPPPGGQPTPQAGHLRSPRRPLYDLPRQARRAETRRRSAGRVRPARYRPPQHRNRRRRRRRRAAPQRPRHPHRPHRLRRPPEGVKPLPPVLQRSHLKDPTMRLPATIMSVTHETPTVKSFALDLGGREIGFSAGQWVDLFVTIEGAEAVGGYSITSSPAEQTSIRLAVKHDGSDHPVTNWLHDAARAGDVVEVSLGGDFTYTPDEARSVVLIGGGIGMTPLMSIVRAVDEIARVSPD